MEKRMPTSDKYVRQLDSLDWRVAQEFETHLCWEYDESRDSLLKLYRKGKRQQWDSDARIDWSQDLDPENPAGMPDEMVSIFGSPVWNRMNARERTQVRHHVQAWHREDRAAGAAARRQVLRGDASRGRGAPRGGVLAIAARKV
jgi:hypothetical protein